MWRFLAEVDFEGDFAVGEGVWVARFTVLNESKPIMRPMVRFLCGVRGSCWISSSSSSSFPCFPESKNPMRIKCAKKIIHYSHSNQNYHIGKTKLGEIIKTLAHLCGFKNP